MSVKYQKCQSAVSMGNGSNKTDIYSYENVSVWAKEQRARWGEKEGVGL